MPIFNNEVRQQLINFLKERLWLPDGELYAHYYGDEDPFEDEDYYYTVAADCQAEHVFYGASKMVLFYPEFPEWVVKIPFKGEYYEEEGYFSNFSKANKNTYAGAEYDYCATEAFLAEKTREAELGYLFAQTYYLFSFNGVPIYVSENIDGGLLGRGWKNKKQSVHAATDISSCCSKNLEASHFNFALLAHFIDCYGEDAVLDLLSFVEQWNINDLHLGNAKIDNKGNVRLIDYSGFNS